MANAIGLGVTIASFFGPRTRSILADHANQLAHIREPRRRKGRRKIAERSCAGIVRGVAHPGTQGIDSFLLRDPAFTADEQDPGMLIDAVR
jgi:hypothetical protein